MRKYTKEREKINRRMRAQEEEFLAEFEHTCWFCGGRGASIHHIASGTAGRVQAKVNRIAWASACWACNSNHLTDNGEQGEWPIVVQYGVKLVRDPKFFDPAGLNKMRGNAPGHITRTEAIVAYCRRFDR